MKIYMKGGGVGCWSGISLMEEEGHARHKQFVQRNAISGVESATLIFPITVLTKLCV